MLNLLRKSAARQELGRVLEQQLASRARAPCFFQGLGVPDTLDGRFDVLALHAWLALVRLKEVGRDEAAQALTDALFVGFDEALREQGVSDMGMGRRMKAIANAFYGRLAAYDAARSTQEMAEALPRRWRAMSGAVRLIPPRRGAWPLMSKARAPRWPHRIWHRTCWISDRCQKQCQAAKQAQENERCAFVAFVQFGPAGAVGRRDHAGGRPGRARRAG
jgi:cytochrome b pre-mRNA-processing protein 3